MNNSRSFQSQIPRHLWQQLALQKKILHEVRALLPDTLAKQVCHCLISDDKLLIYTDSAVWATQLRFYQTKIQAAFQTLVSSVHIRLTSDVNVMPATEHKAKLPSLETIKDLEQDSLAIEDETLRQALLHLSETLARLSKQR